MMKHIQLKWKPYHVLNLKIVKIMIQQGAGMAVMKTTNKTTSRRILNG
ncbi:MAG: hypothetical protein ACLR43_13675 [Faecalibacillus faecis]